MEVTLIYIISQFKSDLEMFEWRYPRYQNPIPLSSRKTEKCHRIVKARGAAQQCVLSSYIKYFCSDNSQRGEGEEKGEEGRAQVYIHVENLRVVTEHNSSSILLSKQNTWGAPNGTLQWRTGCGMGGMGG